MDNKQTNSSLTLEASLKSIETENWLDRVFYRRIGFYFAKLLSHTKVTPNQITIASFFVGMAGGAAFFFEDWRINLLGILFFVVANIMDCIDGQLARLTGIKSALGRILDGFAGNLWFATLYFALFFRGYVFHELPFWTLIFVVLSGLSHRVQALITDYYKTFHLYLISKEKGREFANSETLKSEFEQSDIKRLSVMGVFELSYIDYTLEQEKATPQLQKLLNVIRTRYNGEMPDEIRQEMRQRSLRLMPWFDCMTFNGRTPVLFVAGCFTFPFYVLYPFYEIVVLNIIKAIAIRKHEKMCKEITLRLTMNDKQCNRK